MKTNYYSEAPNSIKPSLVASFPYQGKKDKSDLKPKDLVVIIEHLIQWYQIRRSTQLAFSITGYIEALLNFCDTDLDTEEYCQYRRMEKKWRYIASRR